MNPNWTRDEAVLALDLYVNGFGRRMPSSQADAAVVALSDLLQRLAIHPSHTRPANFRSPSSVYLKLSNFRNIDPSTDRLGSSHGAEIDREVWAEFADDPGRLRKAAETIRRLAGHANSSAPTAE